MKKDLFKIGESFWTGSGEWVCTDIGIRVIVAVKKSEIDDWYTSQAFFPRQIDPVLFNEIVFNEYDQDGCYETKEEYEQLIDEG